MALDDFLSGLPVIGGLFDTSDEDAKKELDRLSQLYKDDASYARFTGGYDPSLAEASLVQEDPRNKEMQMSYLSKLMGLADEGLGAEDEAVFAQARREAENAAARANTAIQQQMREKGIGGSGAELAMRQMANQGAINQQAQAGLDQAAAAAKQRALYTQAYGGALGDVRDQDYRTQAGNVDAQNRIAQFNAANLTDASKYKAATKQGLASDRAQQQLQGLSGLGMTQYDYQRALAAERQKKRQAAGQAVGSAIGGSLGGAAGAQTGGAVGAGLGDLF